MVRVRVGGLVTLAEDVGVEIKESVDTPVMEGCEGDVDGDMPLVALNRELLLCEDENDGDCEGLIESSGDTDDDDDAARLLLPSSDAVAQPVPISESDDASEGVGSDVTDSHALPLCERDAADDVDTLTDAVAEGEEQCVAREEVLGACVTLLVGLVVMSVDSVCVDCSDCDASLDCEETRDAVKTGVSVNECIAVEQGSADRDDTRDTLGSDEGDGEALCATEDDGWLVSERTDDVDAVGTKEPELDCDAHNVDDCDTHRVDDTLALVQLDGRSDGVARAEGSDEEERDTDGDVDSLDIKLADDDGELLLETDAEEVMLPSVEGELVGDREGKSLRDFDGNGVAVRVSVTVGDVVGASDSV